MSTVFPMSRNVHYSGQPAYTTSSRQSKFGSTFPIGYRASLFYGNESTASAERRKKEAYRKELDHQMSEIAGGRLGRARDKVSTNSFPSGTKSSKEPQYNSSTILPRLWSKTEPVSNSFEQSSVPTDFASNNHALKQWSVPARRQFSTNQNDSHWWTNILDNTGSVTNRRSETAALITDRRWDNTGFLTDRPADKASRDWSLKQNDQVDRDLFYRPNSLWDANLGKNSDKRVHFGRGGNGIFGQPLTDEEKNQRLSYGEELKLQIEEKRRRKQEEKEKLMREELLLERKIAEYGQEDNHVVRRGRHHVDDVNADTKVPLEISQQPLSNYSAITAYEKKPHLEPVLWPSHKSSTLPISNGSTSTGDRNTRDIRKVASPLSLLQSQSSFIAVPDADSGVSPIERIMLSSPRIGTPRSTAFDQRLNYSKQQSMGSVASLDAENVQLKNQQRLHRLQLLQADNHAMSSSENPDEVLSSFLLRRM